MGFPNLLLRSLLGLHYLWVRDRLISVVIIVNLNRLWDHSLDHRRRHTLWLHNDVLRASWVLLNIVLHGLLHILYDLIVRSWSLNLDVLRLLDMLWSRVRFLYVYWLLILGDLVLNWSCY